MNSFLLIIITIIIFSHLRDCGIRIRNPCAKMGMWGRPLEEWEIKARDINRKRRKEEEKNNF